MNDEYFHIRTKDVRKIAETIYMSLEEMLGWGEYNFEIGDLKTDIINDIISIINAHEKKLGE